MSAIKRIFTYDWNYILLVMVTRCKLAGFSIIFNRIIEMDAKLLIHKYIDCIKKASKQKEYEWLNYLSGLIKNKNLYNLIPAKERKIIEKYYKNYWLQ